MGVGGDDESEEGTLPSVLLLNEPNGLGDTTSPIVRALGEPPMGIDGGIRRCGGVPPVVGDDARSGELFPWTTDKASSLARSERPRCARFMSSFS